MGGSGSGNWWRFQRKKATVEDALVVGINAVRDHLFAGTVGYLAWTSAGVESSVGFSVAGGSDRPTVRLRYRRRDQEDVDIPVRLEATDTQFGGRRWWFACPLVAGGVACNRRAANLYLPPEATFFGCRKCHGLTYRSSQEAHRNERLFRQLGFHPAAAKRYERMLRNL